MGKSETAIELVKRGHRLVADDAVDIRREADQLLGKAPDLIKHYIELRGIGVVNVQQLLANIVHDTSSLCPSCPQPPMA